ncbi:maleylpyruvate isomerase family mycothiol-dependent enzyme [Amycolatopsis sp. NPDC059021]|uniref:maleylpyruvate isomerase family mycothiol-dependent enzyme n=1 Tax=Amycolatopsis sp. NPDC059021 TaxID=3346704 RepID=UPI0036711A39
MSREHGLLHQKRILEALSAESLVLGEALGTASADAPVPACPGWSLGEVVRHVGSVYRMVRRWLLDGRRPDAWQSDPDEGQSLAEFYAAARLGLLEELTAHDPETHADTWWPADRTYGFWRRRMLHETVVHRADTQQAAGQAAPVIDEDIALDGIDEALALWFGQKLPMLGLTGTRTGSVGVLTGGHSWIARAGPEELVAWRCSPEEAERADDVVSGHPQRIFLWLWGRASPSAVSVRGSRDLAAQLWALLRLATR